MPALLPPSAFSHVFEPLKGKRVGYVRPIGNVGDRLIEWAMVQLFTHYQIAWSEVNPTDQSPDVDVLAFGGGGNMGTMWRNNWDLRTTCLSLGIPITILPQSFTSREDRRFDHIYVREQASLELAPSHAVLAPDLALGLDCPDARRPTRKIGVFLRKDSESAVARSWLARDPVKLCKTPQQYLALAGKYQHIVTDRLHFAICGLLHRRRVTLLPNSYHKNTSMYTTWLHRFGCQFAQTPHEALARQAA